MTNLTTAEAAILLAVVIFAGFTTVSLVLIGMEAGAVAFNTVTFVITLFGLSSNEFAPLDSGELSR